MHRLTPLFLLSSVIFALTACPGSVSDPSNPPERSWHKIKSSTYKSQVGDWPILKCEKGNFEYIPEDNSVILGTNGYKSACLFKAELLNLSTLTVGTHLRVTVKQRGGPSKNKDVPSYSQLFVRFGDVLLDHSQIHYMPVASNEDFDATYEFDYIWDIPELSLVLGLDPQYTTGQGAVADLPTIQLKTVTVEAWQ